MANESYEEVRRKRVEENKKKLEELNLPHLSFSLHQSPSPSPRPSPAKQLKRKAAEELLVVRRRSGRLANLPEPVYREIIPVLLRSYGTSGISKHRDLSGRVYASDEARTYAIEKAEEVEAGLGFTYPSFVKPMLQSHTTGGFWLGLPAHFCIKHLPHHDSRIVLVDEDGNESDTTYLAHKRGLSAGWRGFSINHELVDGDALVFQLIKPTAFKVYIIRASNYDSDSS